MLRPIFACCTLLACLSVAPLARADDSAVLRESLVRAERESGVDSLAALQALEAAIAQQQALEDYSVELDTLHEWFERARASSTRLRGAGDVATVRLQVQHSALLARMERNDEAIALADAARAAADANGDAWLIAQAMFAQGNTRFWARELVAGEPFIADALARMLALAPTLPANEALLLEARSHRLLAFAKANSGRFDGAREHYERVLVLTDGLDGEPRAIRRRALLDYGDMEARRGNPVSAIARTETALALLEPGASLSERADALYALASTLSQSGDDVRALDLLHQTLELEQKIDPPRMRDRGVVRLLLATVQERLGRFAQAAATYQLARPDLEQSFPADSPVFAVIDNNVGIVHLAQQRPDVARVHFERSFAHYPENAVPDRWFALTGLATAKLWLGESVAAERDFATALAGVEASIGARNHAASFVRTGHAAALWARGDVDAAFDEATTAERSRQALVGDIALEFSERHALALKDSLEPSYDWVVALAARSGSPEHVRTAWSLAATARGEVSEAVALRRAQARAADDPGIAARWRSWSDANEAYAEALVASAQGTEPDLAAVETARSAYDDAERALARRVAAVRQLRRQRETDPITLQRALPEHSVLVVYTAGAHAQPHHFDRRAIAPGESRMFAFVLAREGAPRIVDLGPLAGARAALAAWRDATSDPGVPRERVDAFGATVRARLWQPLALPSDTELVLALLPESLPQVNLAALPSGGGRYLADEGPAVHLLEHEADLMRPAPADTAQRLVLIGAPEFGDARAAVVPGTLRDACGLRDAPFARLQHAREELDALASLWRDTRPGLPVASLLGADAREDRVRETLAGGGILHVATHGMYLGSRCDAAEGTRAVSVAAQGSSATDPTVARDLSVLALAGANAGRGDAAHDGLLTSEEILALDLGGTRWAVLSACESGLGRSVEGEGVFGLRRAFRAAGADSVVMSLWRVEDSATADWMQALYRARLRDGASTWQSVRAAQRALLAERRAAGENVHPFYWAAFVASGDWR